jgi:hypothetical protein
MFDPRKLYFAIVIVVFFGIATFAMNPVFAQTLPDGLISIPTPLSQSPTLQQKNALQNITADQERVIFNAIRPTLLQAIQNHTAETGSFRSWQSIIANPFGSESASVNSSATNANVNFVNDAGVQNEATSMSREYHAAASTISNLSTASTAINNTLSTTSSEPSRLQPTCCYPIPVHMDNLLDEDGDGLTDSEYDPGFNSGGSNPPPTPGGLETSLAKEFMPIYYISSGEQQQFANYGDYVPWTVTSLLGTNPPKSYYHVSPYGLATDSNGNQMYAIRVDYLSLWNADGGLVGGGAACFYSYFGLDDVIQELTGHDLDAERSVMLLAAPAVNGGVNPDAKAYKLYSIYTAAHEGTFFDQSKYADFSTPVDAGNHVLLSQSLSKHSTYSFDPNYYPIIPEWFIITTEEAITATWASGEISDEVYLILLAAANDTFYGCVVERFGDQGGQSPSPIVNVGEVSHPLNSSTFIQDNSKRALYLASKLTDPVF